MARSKYWVVVVTLLAAIVLAFASFQFGVRVERTEGNRGLASTQAMLAFGHHKIYESIESFLERKCHDAALTEVREMKNLELKLVADNLRASENDQQVVEYIKLRNPKLLESILTQPVPEPKTYTTTC